MKKSLTLVAALLVLAAGCSAPRRAASQDNSAPRRGGSQDSKPEARAAPQGSGQSAGAESPVKELRNKLLTSKPEEVGLGGEDVRARVWGVLMDVALPAGVATLVSLRDGTASLYTSTGGGVLGGYTAQAEAKAFVSAAESQLARMRPASSFPYPEAGRVKFYLLTRDGVFTAEAEMKELEERGHELSPLFYSADRVLTRLRLASEKQQQ